MERATKEKSISNERERSRRELITRTYLDYCAFSGEDVDGFKLRNYIETIKTPNQLDGFIIEYCDKVINCNPIDVRRVYSTDLRYIYTSKIGIIDRIVKFVEGK